VLWNRAIRLVRAPWALALCGTLALSACASKYALVPPRLDLEPYGRVALVTFSTEQANSELSTLATQRFAEALLASQSRIELLELGAADSSLARLAASGDGSALAQALGRQKDVPAVFVGQLKVSEVKPRARLSGSGSLKVRASVSAELSVRLVSTRTGGTVWRSSAVANGTVGQMSIADRLPSIAMRDPSEAYGEVVGELVTDVTRDFRPTRVKQ
jgi:hypothetical protein